MIYHVTSYLDRLFYCFSDGFCRMYDNLNYDNVEVNNGCELDTNNAIVFDHYC